jgi:hypothetical protein
MIYLSIYGFISLLILMFGAVVWGYRDAAWRYPTKRSKSEPFKVGFYFLFVVLWPVAIAAAILVGIPKEIGRQYYFVSEDYKIFDSYRNGYKIQKGQRE